MPEISDEMQGIINAIPTDFASPEADYQAVRATMAPFHGHPVGDDFNVELLEYGGVRCGRYHLADKPSAVTAFHCHGGALVSCSLDVYHFYAEMIARQTGYGVVMPDYRLAPEHTFPAAHDDCYNGYVGMLDSGVDPSSVVVMGESCGGGLAIDVLVRARDAGLPMPAGFVSLTGWFDLSVAGETFDQRDPFLTPEWVRNRGKDYSAGKAALNDPRLSPAYADLTGLPPMYLQVGQFDTVREGAIRLAENALKSGVAVTLESWPGMIHGWHGLVNAGVPEALTAWQAIKRYIEELVAD